MKIITIPKNSLLSVVVPSGQLAVADRVVLRIRFERVMSIRYVLVNIVAMRHEVLPRAAALGLALVSSRRAHSLSRTKSPSLRVLGIEEVATLRRLTTAHIKYSAHKRRSCVRTGVTNKARRLHAWLCSLQRTHLLAASVHRSFGVT